MTSTGIPSVRLSIGEKERDWLAQQPAKHTLGRVRAGLFCTHPDRLVPIASVRGSTVISGDDRYSLTRETSDVAATCRECRRQWMLDIPMLRSLLPPEGAPKIPIDVERVGRRVPADD
jgi:hypothetical protein